MALDAVGQAMGLALFGSLIPLLLGAAVIEDIIVVSVLAVLQSVAATGNLSFQDIGISTGWFLRSSAGFFS
jgi:hypothetical protein